jgi:O-antigen/teichoic acid export membrane protein
MIGNRNRSAWQRNTDPGFLRDLMLVHGGVLALLVLYRLDQVLLAHFGYTSELGEYSIAVAVVESSTGPAVVIAQRALSSFRLAGARLGDVPRLMRASATAGTFVASGGALGLYLVTVWMGTYLDAPLYACLLIPGAVALCAAKPASASLVASGRVAPTTVIAGVTTTTGVVCYALFLPSGGAVWACVISSLSYCLLFVLTAVTVRVLSAQTEQ